jgi:hypothetical protein
LVRANEELVSAYEGLDPRARRDVRVELGFLPFPADIALLSAMQLNEAALHGRDVRVAFDPLAGLANQEADIPLEQITGQLNLLLGFQAKPAALDGKTATLRVDTTDPDRALGLVLGPTVGLGDPGQTRRHPRRPGGGVCPPARREAPRGQHTRRRHPHRKVGGGDH